MATIKAYTDLDQSRKLAEILPIETADMLWVALNWQETEYYVEVKQDGINQPKKAIPCWSLTALLGILLNNENISTTLSKGGYRLSTLEQINDWFVDYEDETNGLNNCVTSADNPIDACVAMIEKLGKLKRFITNTLYQPGEKIKIK